MPYSDIEKRRSYIRSYRRKQREENPDNLLEDYKKFQERLKNYTPEQRKVKHLRRRVRNKVRAFLVLGGKCVRCGETDIRLLTINHKEGIGSKDVITERLYTQIKNFERSDLELLCWNCQVLFEWDKEGKNCSKDFKAMLNSEVKDHKINQGWNW